VAFEQLTRLFALLVLGILAAILVTLVLEAASPGPVRPRLSVARRMGPGAGALGALGAIYGTLVTSPDRDADPASR